MTQRCDEVVGIRRRVVDRARLHPTVLAAAAAGLVGFLVYEISREPSTQVFNTYVWLADALNHGRLDMPEAPAWLDWITYEGRRYSHQGLLPGVLLMPFVKAFGLGFELPHFACLLGGGISAAAWVLAHRIGLTGWRQVAGWAFPVLGTTIWFEAKAGTTWGVAALSSALFLLLALNEYFGKRRLMLLGLMVGLAALSRAPAVLALLGFALALRQPRKIVQLGLGAALPVLVMVGYNVTRFGTVTDKALELHYLRDGYRSQVPPGLFSLAHIPHNLYSWFLLGPRFEPPFPFIRPTIMGTAITLTSPAFFTAFAARRERWMWLAAVVVVIPAALLYANGFAQFGMRYLLDAVPFLSAMTMVALRDGDGRGYLPLLFASIAINAYGVAFTNVYGLLGA